MLPDSSRPQLIALTLALALAPACGAGPAADAAEDPAAGPAEVAAQAGAAGAGAWLWPGAIAYRDACTEGGFNPYSLCSWAVTEGVQRWNAVVGFLPLVPRTTESNYLVFRSSGSGVEGGTTIGMEGGAQNVYLPEAGREAAMLTAFLHEVGHAAGLQHEHARPDREWFVRINESNLDDPAQFAVSGVGAVHGWYDFRSVMHYRAADMHLWAIDPATWTMVAATGAHEWPGGGTLSQGDINTLLQLYYPDTSERFDVRVSLAANRAEWAASARRNGFAPRGVGHHYACLPGEQCELADVDANGTADLVVFNHGRGGYSSVYTALSDGGGFGATVTAHPYFCTAGEVCALGDVDGDRRADLITFTRNAVNAVYVASADPARPGKFRASFVATQGLCGANAQCAVADVDGNGSADLLAIDATTRAVTVVRTHSSASGFSVEPAYEAPASMGSLIVPTAASAGQLRLGDVDGDGRADAVWFARVDGRVFVALSRPASGSGIYAVGPRFAPFRQVHGWFCVGSEECALGDVDGDAKLDLVTFDRASGATWVAINGSSVGAPSFGGGWWWGSTCSGTATCALGDVNGDGAADAVELMR